ncbi:MBL fold metallo-hydrolase [Taibaiella soli]|uniref:MBL fold metallo-hydrolase n=1 Tax=Taibaiella soli TaxID=1649169 RepID=A0A2W2BXS2_9BACT|nr:MBL fold metallo-hydrolase [Taibaiella soli]PZF72653.1 MBL fold metallo-hydrolase [Taibaiella soli]
MRIIPLKEGNFLVSKTKEFSVLEDNDESEGIRMAVQPFLVMTNDENILLDAGVGWLENGHLKLFDNLKEAHVSPESISKVLLSHLHKDHINGLVIDDENGLRLAFPQSKIYIQRREYEYALTKTDSPSFDFVRLNFLINYADIVWMDANEGAITPEINYVVTGGHTPFHQVFRIQSEGKIIFYGADNLPQSRYFDMHVAYKTDYDGKKAMQWRIQWEAQAKAEHWQILLYHDLSEPVIQF